MGHYDEAYEADRDEEFKNRRSRYEKQLKEFRDFSSAFMHGGQDKYVQDRLQKIERYLMAECFRYKDYR